MGQITCEEHRASYNRVGSERMPDGRTLEDWCSEHLETCEACNAWIDAENGPFIERLKRFANEEPDLFDRLFPFLQKKASK